MGCEGRVVNARVVALAARAARLLGGRGRKQLRKGWGEPCGTAVHGKESFPMLMDWGTSSGCMLEV